MEITDLITITELSKMTNKSRPTIYKFITDYQKGKRDSVPETFLVLFDKISEGKMLKKELYEYCENNFFKQAQGDEELMEIIVLLRQNKEKIDLENLKQYIKEIISK